MSSPNMSEVRRRPELAKSPARGRSESEVGRASGCPEQAKSSARWLSNVAALAVAPSCVSPLLEFHEPAYVGAEVAE